MAFRIDTGAPSLHLGKGKIGAEETLTFGDNDRNKTDYCYTECDQIVRKLHHQFYFKRREKAYEQCKPAKAYR